jgi:hypothetical protein
VYIYQRLRHVEKTNDVCVLEEAGRLLLVQMTGTSQPRAPASFRETTYRSRDGNNTVTPPPTYGHATALEAPQDISPAPPVYTASENIRTQNLPLRTRTTPFTSTATDPSLQPAASQLIPASSAVLTAHTYPVKDDTHLLPLAITVNININLNDNISNPTKITIPLKITTTTSLDPDPEKTTSTSEPLREEEKIPGRSRPFIDRESAEIARMNEEMLGGGRF